MAFEVDELKPVSKWKDFGYQSAQECALDYSNLDAAHRRCNEWRGSKSVKQVIEIAKRYRACVDKLPQPWEF